jgi:hypothetical protein
MLQSLKKFLPKWLKFLLFDISWDATKTWIGGHITIIVPTAAISFIGQRMVRDLYTCLDSPFQCIVSNYSEILLVIGLVLMLLSILINNKESEKKFTELNKKISAKEQSKPNRISEEVKKEIKTVIAKYFHILATERKVLGRVQAQALRYFKELPNDFDAISRNPEVVEDEGLFRMIENARNKAEVILNMAANVVSEEERLIGNKMTNHEYLQSVEPIFSQFEEHKKEIFQHLRNL